MLEWFLNGGGVTGQVSAQVKNLYMNGQYNWPSN